MGTENIGRAPTAQVAEQHRGSQEISREELARMYPPIRVKGRRAHKRALEPHDYRCAVTDYVGRWLCNLCGLKRFDPESLHFL